MSERIRFHLDEQIDPAIAWGLRRHEIDVTTTVEVELQGQADEVQLEFASSQYRVLVTHDVDFLIIASQFNEHWGIAYCKQGTRSIGQIIQRLIQVYEQLDSEEMKGKVQYL
jgi:predicted nuclease of predicted toxin-antitoxin system